MKAAGAYHHVNGHTTEADSPVQRGDVVVRELILAYVPARTG